MDAQSASRRVDPSRPIGGECCRPAPTGSGRFGLAGSLGRSDGLPPKRAFHVVSPEGDNHPPFPGAGSGVFRRIHHWRGRIDRSRASIRCWKCSQIKRKAETSVHFARRNDISSTACQRQDSDRCARPSMHVRRANQKNQSNGARSIWSSGRRSSRKAGSLRTLPRLSRGSSTQKPGPSVAISNRTPHGALKPTALR
ncbi:hypothetical protein EDE10_101340 [Bradyrhizobium sp. Y-H1]|nr:hypothetical protein EDE10_101340 [Bradyrhizobium sp. Y-H1]